MRSALLAKAGLITTVGALALLATGCISIKSGQTVVTQRAPGVVTLGATFCVSDYDQSSYTTCHPGNIQELDSRASGSNTDGDQYSSPPAVQLLVAFRVPNGAIAPQSFQNDTQSTTFNFSQSYTDELTKIYTAVPGQRWVGYISGFKDSLDPINKTADQTFGEHAEFGIPSAADGGPAAGPFKYRITGGLRGPLNEPSDSSLPVVCGGFTFCADSPANTPPNFPADLSKAVSDFGVLAGSRGTAGQGGMATVNFPIKYADGGGLGARDLALSASTTLPGGTATPGAEVLRVTPGSTSSMNVTVAVPAAAPLGDYSVTLTARNGSPAVTRSNRATITVIDQVAPSIRISTPPNGSTFTFGQSVVADYGCDDQTNASGVQSCSGPVANGTRIATSSLGAHQFTVNAADNAGNTPAATTAYTIRPRSAPAVTMPFSYLRFIPKTALSFLQIRGIPKGSTLTVVCKGKRCPVKKRFRQRNPKKNVTLKRFFPKAYPPGTQLEARVTKLGSVTTIRRVFFRKNKRPTSAKFCLAPGAKKPKRC